MTDGATKEARLVPLTDSGFSQRGLCAGKSTHYKVELAAKAARCQTFKKNFYG